MTRVRASEPTNELTGRGVVYLPPDASAVALRHDAGVANPGVAERIRRARIWRSRGVRIAGSILRAPGQHHKKDNGDRFHGSSLAQWMSLATERSTEQGTPE